MRSAALATVTRMPAAPPAPAVSVAEFTEAREAMERGKNHLVAYMIGVPVERIDAVSGGPTTDRL